MIEQMGKPVIRASKARDMEKLKFSASYASRYHNCHGSARLSQAIEGFEYPEKNDRGMKGEGTVLHKIFQEVLEQCDDIPKAADMLEILSGLYYKDRDALVKDKKNYIVWWFMAHKEVPPVPWEIISQLIYTTTGEAEGKPIVNEFRVQPRRIVHLCEALRYMDVLMKDMKKPVLILEEELKATWLETAPGTTADAVLYDDEGDDIHIVDLKMGDVSVSPMGNEQLMYYLKTWLVKLGRKFKNMQVHILQRKNLDYWPVSNKILEDWAVDVKKSEAEILAGDLSLTPGDHCTFCPANPHGRGDRGSKSCPAMLTLLYGERDAIASDAAIISEEDYDDE